MFELNNCIFWFLLPIDVSIISSSPRIMGQLRFFFQGLNKSHSTVSFSPSQITDKDVMVFSIYNTATEEQDFTNFKNAQPHFPLYTPLAQFQMELSRKRPKPAPPIRIFRKQLHDYGFRVHSNGSIILHRPPNQSTSTSPHALTSTATIQDKTNAQATSVIINPIDASNDQVNKPNYAKRPSIWFEQHPVCSVPLETAMNADEKQAVERKSREKGSNGQSVLDNDIFVTRPLNVVNVEDDSALSKGGVGKTTKNTKGETSSSHRGATGTDTSKDQVQRRPHDVVSNDLEFDAMQVQVQGNKVDRDDHPQSDSHHPDTTSRPTSTDPQDNNHSKSYWQAKRAQLWKLKSRLVHSISNYYTKHTSADKSTVAILQEKQFPSIPDPYFLSLEDLYTCITSQRLASYLQFINTRDQDNDEDSIVEHSTNSTNSTTAGGKHDHLTRLKDLGLLDDSDVTFGVQLGESKNIKGIGRSTTFTASLPHKFTHFAALGPMLGYCSDPLYSYKSLSLLESDRVADADPPRSQSFSSESKPKPTNTRNKNTSHDHKDPHRHRPRRANAEKSRTRQRNPEANQRYQASITRVAKNSSKNRKTTARSQNRTARATHSFHHNGADGDLPMSNQSDMDGDDTASTTTSTTNTNEAGKKTGKAGESLASKLQQASSGSLPPQHRRVQSSTGPITPYANGNQLSLDLDIDDGFTHHRSHHTKASRANKKSQDAAFFDTNALSSIHQTFSNSQYHHSLVSTHSFSNSNTQSPSNSAQNLTPFTPPQSSSGIHQPVKFNPQPNTPVLQPSKSSLAGPAALVAPKSQPQSKQTAPTKPTKTATTITTTTTTPSALPQSPPQLSISLDETINDLQSRLQLEHSTIRHYEYKHASEDGSAADLTEKDRRERDRKLEQLEQQEREEISRLYSYNHSTSGGHHAENDDEFSTQYSTTLSSGYGSTLASYNMHTYFEKKKKAANVKSWHPANGGANGAMHRVGPEYANNRQDKGRFQRNVHELDANVLKGQTNGQGDKTKKSVHFSTMFAQNTHRDQTTYYLLSPLTISQTNALFHPYTIFHKCKSQLELNQLAFQLLLNPFQQRLLCLNTHWGYFMYPTTTPTASATPTAASISSVLPSTGPPGALAATTAAAGPNIPPPVTIAAPGVAAPGGLVTIPAASTQPIPSLTNHNPHPQAAAMAAGPGFRDRLIDLQHAQYLLSSLRIIAYDITSDDEFHSMIRYIKTTYTQSAIKDVSTITTPLQTTFTLFLAYNNHIMDDALINERRNQIKYELNKVYLAVLLQNPYCTEPVFISMPVDVQQQTDLFTSLITKYIIDLALLRVKLQIEQ